MNVDGVRNGIVLDHIAAGKSMEIYRLLNLDQLSCCLLYTSPSPRDRG